MRAQAPNQVRHIWRERGLTTDLTYCGQRIEERATVKNAPECFYCKAGSIGGGEMLRHEFLALAHLASKGWLPEYSWITGLTYEQAAQRITGELAFRLLRDVDAKKREAWAEQE